MVSGLLKNKKGDLLGFLEEQGHIVSNPDTLNMDLIGLQQYRPQGH